MPEFIEAISSVPPCRAETLAWSLPSWPLGNTLTLILPPDLAATISANFSMPWTMGWPAAFWLANLMTLSWAAAMPTVARAAVATRVLINSRFMGCLQLFGLGRGGRKPLPWRVRFRAGGGDGGGGARGTAPWHQHDLGEQDHQEHQRELGDHERPDAARHVVHAHLADAGHGVEHRAHRGRDQADGVVHHEQHAQEIGRA